MAIPVSRLSAIIRADQLGRGTIAFQFAQCGVEQLQPVSEVVLFQPRDGDVLDHGIARELAAIVQDRSPESLHAREVRRPVGDALVENGAEQFILADGTVECFHKAIDVVDSDADILRRLFLGSACKKSLGPASPLFRHCHVHENPPRLKISI